MAQGNDKPKPFSVFKALRDVRDVGIDALAKRMITITSSAPYSLASSALAKPGLVMMAVTRRKRDALMAEILARANMPSRADVLALSTRLAHIEMALDDLGAAMDAMRASAQSTQSPAPAKRAAVNSLRAARPVPPPEG
jgi:hypothetical protein